MNRKKIFCILCLCAIVMAAYITPAISQDIRVRAKIGILIQSGDRVMPAKSRDRLKAGDLIRIYVHPEKSSYIYVIHTDHKTVTLLNMIEQRIHSSTFVLPSLQDFYQVDGKSPNEAFTVICSTNELKEISGLSNSEMSYEQWIGIEKGLMEKSKIDLSSRSEKPFAVLGNVRNAEGGDKFANELKIFSGKLLLVKRYEFKVDMAAKKRKIHKK